MKTISSILAAAILAGGSIRSFGELANGVKAIVDDAVITYQEVELLDEQTADRLRSQYPNDRETFEEKRNQMRKENLQKLLEWQLILREFKTAGYNLPESVVEDIVQDSIKSEFRDRATATMSLQARGLTYEKYRQRVRERFIVQQMKYKNVTSEIIVSPHKMETYYQTHREEFKIDDEAKLRLIVLKVPEGSGTDTACKLAGDILGRIKDGVSFSEMALTYSQGSQRGQGGDWGWRERSELTKGLADIAFALEKGQCSGVFSRTMGDDYWVYQYETNRAVLARHYGVDPATRKQTLIEERRLDGPNAMANLPPAQEFYLLQLEDKRATRYKPLADVREQIEKNLQLDERRRLEQQWIDKLKKKTFVAYF